MSYYGVLVFLFVVIGLERYIKKNPEKISPRIAFILVAGIMGMGGGYMILMAFNNIFLAGYIFGSMLLFAGLALLIESAFTKPDKLKIKYEKMFKLTTANEKGSNT